MAGFSVAQNMENLGRYLRRARFVMLPNRYGETPILRARFNDAVFVSLRHRYLFTSNEKVANSTLRATFQSLECNGHLPRHYKPFKRWTGPLLQPSDIGEFPALLNDPGIRKFCVVRHPYTRLISCFRDKFEREPRGAGYRRKMRELGLPCRKKLGFGEFLEAVSRQPQQLMNSHWRIQYYNVFMDRIHYGEIIRYEELPERLPRLLTELYHKADAGAVLTRHRQEKSSDALVEQYFTPELKALAHEVYGLDFQTFGYVP
ncbi:MAG: sulfotransferase family 2 domain-containing protein [Alphaproteobacteria bacterium]|nr:sulfotransferase family 2 domain-containing protein [Alphaproteobacteria bacterium]